MMRSFRAFLWLVRDFLIGVSTPSSAGEDVGPFVRAVWLVQRHGKPEVVRPEYDQKLKGKWLMSGNWCGCQALAQRDGAPRRRKSLPDGQMRGE